MALRDDVWSVVSVACCHTELVLLKIPGSGEPRTQKLKFPLMRKRSLKFLPLKLGVGQYIVTHATLTARDFFRANLFPSGPFTWIFSKTSPEFFFCVLAVASQLVGALSPVNHKGLHQGWTQISIYLQVIHFESHHTTSHVFEPIYTPQALGFNAHVRSTVCWDWHPGGPEIVEKGKTEVLLVLALSASWQKEETKPNWQRG